MQIGFIGLGLMGAAMVGRLQDKGHQLTVKANRSRKGVDTAVSRGAKEVQSPKAVAENSDIVMLCVSTSDQVESLMRGPEGMIAGLRPDAVVIDFGTSLPGSTRVLAEEVAAAGGQYLDAPLGRTPAHAKDGLLNIMTAGNEQAYKKVHPVLQELGENVFYLGDSGAGHTIKLLNNFLGTTVANACSELFAMAEKAGVERQTVYDVISSGPLGSGMFDFVKGYAVDGDPTKLEFSISNANKDVGYYKQMLEDVGQHSSIASAVHDEMSAAIEDGRGNEMVSQMVDFYDNRNGD